MSFLTPIGALGALIAIPIILLYILRLRRRETVVSSHYLWQQILRDHEANTPWQRLRRNILLILQLIILALLVLALMRPAQIIPTITASKTVILLDASTSMNATDGDGASRFAQAQQEALLLLNELGVDDELAVIRVGNQVETLTNYTRNFRDARTAITSAQTGEGRADWSTALTLAVAGAQGAEQFSIIIISDNTVPEAQELPENIPAPQYRFVGTSSANVAITALAPRTLAGANTQLFAQVHNYSDDAHEVTLVVRLDGNLWDSVTGTLNARSERAFVFEVDQTFDTVQAELILPAGTVDHLAVDNRAYAVASDTRTRRVLLLSNQRNIFIEEVLRSLPGVQSFRGDASNPTLPATPYDLYVFNGYLPTTLPDADMLIINPPRDSELFTLGAERTDTANLSVSNRDHPLASFLNVESVNLLRFRQLNGVEWARPIVSASGGDVLLAGENRGRQIAIMGFDLLNSDLPLQIAFPILIANMVEWSTPTTLINQSNLSIGDSVRINPANEAQSVRVTRPDGSLWTQVIASETLTYTDTEQAGLYSIALMDADEAVLTEQMLAVNVFGLGESDITPLTDADTDVNAISTDTDAEEQVGWREWWPTVVLLALLVLILEWYVSFKQARLPDSTPTDLRRSTARR
ncbi:MAG: vWA domain-containing protein [Anaerolineae bacterium]